MKYIVRLIRRDNVVVSISGCKTFQEASIVADEYTNWILSNPKGIYKPVEIQCL